MRKVTESRFNYPHPHYLPAEREYEGVYFFPYTIYGK